MKTITTLVLRPAGFVIAYTVGAVIVMSAQVVGYQFLFQGGRPPEEFGWSLGLPIAAWFVLIRFGGVNLPAIVIVSLLPRFRHRLSLVFPLIAGLVFGLVPWPFCALARRLTNSAFNPNLETLSQCVPFNMAALATFLSILSVYLLATRRIERRESNRLPVTD